MVKQRAFSVLGNIAIVNFLNNYKGNKKKFAEKVLKNTGTIVQA
jgi:hypothetical protein